MGWHGWFNVSGGRAALGSPITVVARNPDHLDLFVTGTDGGIYSTWWDAASGWAGWFQVSGGRAALGSPVTAIARNPNHLDLFVTGTDGGIYSTWWDAASGWAGWFQVSGGRAHLGAPITAVARNPNHLDLFVTGTDGRIYSTWWDAASGWAGWFNVSGGAAAPRSRINAVARNPNHLDLFVTGTDGGIYSTWWDAASGWAGWFNVSGGAAALASPIDVIARYPDHLDLFVTGTDGGIYSTWWHQTELIRLHVKVLGEPTSFTRAQMVQAMQQVYATAGIDVVVGSVETLNLPLLNDLDVGACTMGNTTAEQNQLFANRNNSGANDLCVYFVRSTLPPLNGCAAHPAGQPSAVVTSVASQWTLGHEVGHVLGLPHVAPTDRLMMGGGTWNITNPPPDLVQSEIDTMIASPLTQ
jgi:hypothetical protein